MAKTSEQQICCSFCGKRQDQVHRMMAGMDNAFICDACIELCAEIMDEEDDEEIEEDIDYESFTLEGFHEEELELDDFVNDEH